MAKKQQQFNAIQEVSKQAETLDKTLSSISNWELANPLLSRDYWDAHTALQHVVTRYINILAASLGPTTGE